MLIDTQMPVWEQRLTRAMPVDAAVPQTYRAIRKVDLFESPWQYRNPRDRWPAQGFKVVADDGATELVLGFIGRWWRAESRLAWSPADLPAFDRPGYGVGVWSLSVLGYGEHGSVLVAEVRIRCTDAAARHALGAYFSLTSPLITAMGHPALRRIRRAAENLVAPVAVIGDGSPPRERRTR